MAKREIQEDWSQIRIPQTPRSKRMVGMIGIVCIIIAYHFITASNTLTMPAMAGEIGGMDLYPLALSLYSMMMVIFVPLAGALARTGDKGKLFMIGAAIYAVAALANCFVTDMMQTLVCRIVMGFGGAFQSCLFFLVIGDLWDDRERPKFQAWFGTAVGISLLLGSALTGIVIENASWRLVYGIFVVPFFVIGIILMKVSLPKYPPEISKDKGGKLDVPGLVTLCIGIACLVIVLTFQGSRLQWNDWPIWVLLVVGIVFIFLFVKFENKAGEAAIINMKLFKTRTVWAFLGAAFSVAASVGISAYSGRALTQLNGVSPTMIGTIFSMLQIAPILLSTACGSMLGKKPWLYNKLLGFGQLLYGVCAVALCLTIYEGATTPVWVFFVIMVVSGLVNLPSSFAWVAAGCAVVPPEMRTGANTLVRIAFMLGSSIGTAVYGGIINSAGENFGLGYSNTMWAIAITFVLSFICGLRLKVCDKPKAN